METRIPPLVPTHEAPKIEIEGSQERGYRHEGFHYYTWEPERAAVASWVRELSPFDRPEAEPEPAPAPKQRAGRRHVASIS